LTVGSNNNRVSYTGNGATTAFAFSYPYRASSDLVVTVRTTATGAESVKTEGADYTVSGTPTSDAGGFASGTVTFGTAPASGTQVHIDRVVALTQGGDFVSGDGVPPSLLEGALDKITLAVQELDSRFGRTLLQPRTAANRNLILPEPTSATANQVLSVNASGTGYTLRSGSAPAGALVSAVDYGATGNGTTDDATSIQNAINALNALGGGVLYFPAGTYLIGATLTLYSKVILRGAGADLSVIKAKNSLNADMVKTVNYATLTGQNKYLIADGVPYAFGLEDIQLDGNKANQASGNGLVVYGKRYTLKNVTIYNIKGIGWVSEGWYNVNTATQPEQPESFYQDVDVQNCGSHGVQYRGPSDAFWDAVFVHQNDGWGIRFETDGATYNGASDVVHIHVYANVTGGIYNSCKMRFGHVATESNFGEGLVEAGFATSYGYIESYINCRTTGTYALTFSGNATEIGRLWNADGSEAVSGALITGSFLRLNSGTFNGDSSTGVGLTVAGSQNYISATVYGYKGAGGRGVVFGNGGTALNTSTVALQLYDNTTGYTVATQGTRCQGTLGIFANAGQAVSGTALDTNAGIDVLSFHTDTSASVSQRLAPVGTVTVPGFAFSGDENTGIFRSAADTLNLTSGGVEVARFINSGGTGFLAVGASNLFASPGGTFPLMQVNRNTAQAGVFAGCWQNSATAAAQAVFAKSKSGAVNTHTVVASGDVLGEVHFVGSGGTSFHPAALIKAEVDGTPGNNDMPGRLVFSTTADGAAAVTERLRISANGAAKFINEVRIAGDVGGEASTNTLTGVSDLTTNSTGVGTILFKGATSRNSSGFIKIYIGTTAYYLPAFSAITG
jgi:hypothetical protein